ncbi:hypothetical protein EZY14_013435 [Kordia sp. TARA_039_SRF]|nr:hypothetical protein EZY14_013435 [Kordia sp. TARA_039_SRF]
MSYENITPIFNNKLDKLKFLIKKYKHDFEVEKKKGNEDLQTFLNISIHEIDEVIADILTEIQTVKMTETKIVDYTYYCKRLNSIKTNFEKEKQENDFDEDETNDFLDFYKEIDIKLRPQPKTLLPNSDELTKQFKDVVFNTQKKTTQLKEENIFPDFFKGQTNTNFKIFNCFAKKYIISAYKDFSFLIANMSEENRIHNQKHKIWYKWLHQEKYINDKDYDTFLRKGNLLTFDKSYSEQRLNNYYNVIQEIEPEK